MITTHPRTIHPRAGNGKTRSSHHRSDNLLKPHPAEAEDNFFSFPKKKKKKTSELANSIPWA
jgi:hypothetical protein